MKIIDVRQGSEEWLKARAGIPTASELDALVSPTGKIRTGDGLHTYMCRKLAEKWTGFPLQSFGGGAMEQGSILESEALPWFSLTRDVDVCRVGLVLTDDGTFGASPDGMLPDGSGLEIKCPQPPNHVKWLLGGVVPTEYLLQCYGGMYATGADRWTFLSYCPRFPAFVKELRRDAAIMDTIALALEDFHESMANALATLRAADTTTPAYVGTDSHPF